MYKKILGPLDGSDPSECALNHIKAVAMGCQVPEVVLLTVVGEPTPIIGVMSGQLGAERQAKLHRQELETARQKAEDYLGKVSARLNKEGLAVKTEVLTCGVSQNVADCILGFARDNQVDLIVMSTHGRSGLSRWAFGSVADKVVRASPIPVLTVTPAGCRVFPTA